MTPEQLASIRASVKDGWSLNWEKSKALLAEVDRLRAEVDRLGRELTARDAEVARKAKVEALREVAAKWTDEIYPVDIFVPLTAEDHAEINRVLKEHFGRSSARDAISGDMMRRAANLLRLHADEIETEARADAATGVYDRQMENDFNSLDDDGALDDLANDYAGVDDTAQSRGEL